MSQKSYSAGSDFPELENGKLRLYSMRFDPLAQRVRLVLAAKNIPLVDLKVELYLILKLYFLLFRYQTININLVKKPDWFLTRVPSGTVPAIEHEDGKVVYESMIVCEYLDSFYPDNRLIPAEPYTRARQQITLDAFSRVTAAYFKTVRTANPESLNDLNR